MNNVLSNLSATWKKVEAIQGGFSNVPDGDYTGDLKELALGQAKKGRWQVVASWEVADGEHTGETQKQFYGISDDSGKPDAKGMGYFKNVCEIIGLDLPEDANEWQATMNEFIETVCNTALYNITVKSNGNYANVYVNGVSEYTKGEEGAEGEAVEEVATEEFEEATIEEESVEEEVEEVQQVVVPQRRMVAKPIAKPVAKLAAMPTKKGVTQVVPTKKIVSLKRK